MAIRDERAAPRCWAPRLWWLGLLVGLVASYFILRNFSLTYWKFMGLLVAFLTAGALGGKFLGTYIDRNHRTKLGLMRHELRQGKVLLKWLTKALRKHGDDLEAGVIRRKLEKNIGELKTALANQQSSREDLLEVRHKLEQFAEEHLAQFKKSAVREYVESIGVAVLIALALRAFVIEAFQIPSGSMIPTLRVGDHIFVNKLSYGIRIPFLPLKIGDSRIPAVSWNWSMPEPGDVIVFIEPDHEEEDYIKRVIAIGGDKVEVRNGQVLVNDQPYPLKDMGIFRYNALDEGEFVGRMRTRQFVEFVEGVEHSILRKTCVAHRDCRVGMGTECDLEKELCIQPDFGPFMVPEDHVFVMGDNRDNSRDSRAWTKKAVPLEFIKGKAKFIWWSYREKEVQWDRMFTMIR